jgi:hypothetical protein
MKINQLTRFPHPVLEEHTDDYIKGIYTVGIEISESVNTGGLLIRYDIQLTEENISHWITNGTAKACLFITCLESYYNKLHEIALPNGSIEIGKGDLFGNVVVLPLVVLAKDIENYSNESFNDDYAGLSFNLSNSDVLAIGEDYLINVGREKLAPIESIFNLAKNNTIPSNQFSVTLDSEKITILAEENTYNTIHKIRNTTPGKSIVLNSIYFPVLMEVLSVIEQDPETYQDKHWYKVFSAKCAHENINLENPELMRDAQKLLKSPLTRVITVMNEID